MPRAFQLLVCLALAGLIAWNASRTPAPKGPGARGFSAEAARADVEAIAARPHPIGSPDHDRVRDYVAARLRGLGLQTQVWNGEAMEVAVSAGEAGVAGGRVQDVIGLLAGRSRTAPALLVMAHYDTAPGSPGAADDTAGVAVALQVAERLQAQGPPERDVVFLITDGEEAGLLGARAFFTGHPLARRIGAVLNMEARGGGGRVYMFETGPRNGGMIGLFARAATNATANSLSGFVYDRMPNDTDFTLAKAAGLPGLNFAFIGRPFDYHAASSTAANLDQGSVQHMGDQVLAAARALAVSQQLPRRSPDVVYADLLGGPIVHYPAWAGWLVLAAAAGLGLAAVRRHTKLEGFHRRAAAKGALAVLLTPVAAGALAVAARALTGTPAAFVGVRPLLARFGLYEAALATAALAAALGVFALLSRRQPRFWSAFVGALLAMLLLAAGLQLAAPVAAHVAAWPLLAAAAQAAIPPSPYGEGRPRGLIWALLAAPPLAWLLYLAHAVALGVGADIPAAPAALTPFAALLLFPLLWPPAGASARLQLRSAVVLLVVAGVLAGAIQLLAPFSPRFPRPTDIRYVAELDAGRFWRASLLAGEDAWTRAALRAGGEAPRHVALEGLSQAALAAPAPPISPPRPHLRAARLADGPVQIALRPSSAFGELRLEVRTGSDITAAEVDGRPVRLDPGVRRLSLAWSSPAGLELTLRTAVPGPVSGSYAEIRPGWPPDAPPLPARPADAMPWGRSDSAVAIGAFKVP